MIVYHYHPDTGVYLNTSEEAEPDPLAPGKWLIPAHSTPKSPPSPPNPKTQHAVFDGTSWSVQAIPLPPPPSHAENVANMPKNKLVAGPLIYDVLTQQPVDRG